MPRPTLRVLRNDDAPEPCGAARVIAQLIYARLPEYYARSKREPGVLAEMERLIDRVIRAASTEGT